MGEIAQFVPQPYGRRIVVRLPKTFCEVAVGASVSVDGVCLTVVSTSNDAIHFDVVHQSLNITNLADRQVGDAVNCERSLRFGEEVGGHIVSGHVSTTGVINALEMGHEGAWLEIALSEAWIQYIFAQGFVAIDGVSLTVASVDRDRGIFRIALIPETLRATAFSTYTAGERLNIEIENQTKVLVDVLTRIQQYTPPKILKAGS